MKNKRYFTLVELLAVMALIAVLGTIGFGTYSYAKNRAREAATEALLKQIEAGLESFHAKFGYYPASSGNNFSTITLTVDADNSVSVIDFGGLKLTRGTRETDGSLSRKERLKNEQLETFTKTMDMESIKSSLDGSGKLTDAWGGTIYYRAPGVFKKGAYDLVAPGPDGAFGSDKASTPADMTTITIFREAAGERVCDDLFTF